MGAKNRVTDDEIRAAYWRLHVGKRWSTVAVAGELGISVSQYKRRRAGLGLPAPNIRHVAAASERLSRQQIVRRGYRCCGSRTDMVPCFCRSLRA